MNIGSQKLKEIYWWLRYKKIPAYIHIPKTGGTYLAQLEAHKKPVLDPVKYFGHSYVIDGNDDLNPLYLDYDMQNAKEAVVPRIIMQKYFVFSTVRNIFRWLVSYAAHAGGWNSQYVDRNHYDYANANKGFEYLLKVIADREDTWPNRKFIHCQLFSSGGDLIVDWLNRNETLDEDLGRMAGKLKMDYKKKARQRVSGLKDFRTYYTDELIDIVYRTWDREIQLFGYDFDTCNLDKATLKQEIPREQKCLIKYFWGKDKLLIKEKEIYRR